MEGYNLLFLRKSYFLLGIHGERKKVYNFPIKL